MKAHVSKRLPVVFHWNRPMSKMVVCSVGHRRSKDGQYFCNLILHAGAHVLFNQLQPRTAFRGKDYQHKSAKEVI